MATPVKTSDQLRSGIDHGRGDKVRFSDPAASPLGTDDEAAGAPPSKNQIAGAAAHELKPASYDHKVKAPEAGRSISGKETAQTPVRYKIAIMISCLALIMIAIAAIVTAKS